MCGMAAVLMLFVHRPLLVEHGLRSNNMEASLVLAYCGGIYHFLMWRASEVRARGRLHVLAVTLYFVLGFMTKFVAALFLPAIIAAALMLRHTDRSWLAQRWRGLLGAVALAGLLIAPWFVYQHVRFGAVFWEDILGASVYTRLTTYLNPEHVQPWHFYVTTIWNELVAARTELWTLGGLGLLLWRTLRKGWFDGATILLWLVLPMGVISVGTSKLYHYAYPFLPPLALAGGYLAAVALKSVASSLSWLIGQVDLRLPRAARAALDMRAVRAALMVVLVASGLMAAAIVVLGPFKLAPWGHELLRASTPYRLLLVVALAVILWRRVGPMTTGAAVLIVATLLPGTAYREELAQLTVERHPLRSLRDCIQRVGAGTDAAAGRSPVYVEVGKMSHPVAFYLRTLGRWSRVDPSDSDIYSSLYQKPRPVLLAPSRFQALEAAWTDRGRLADIPAVPAMEEVLLLPGRFEACAVDFRRSERR
jgi:4-amino-4-deoxy-L-arabinose transferase-like glycosyltransferase